MALLKKIRAASLVEVLVASAIILIVFAISSVSLNNVFKTQVASNDVTFKNRVKELTYLTKNNKIKIPFYEETNHWDIVIEKRNIAVYIEALHKASGTEKIIEVK